MTLKRPNEKIQSTFATFEFICKELPIIEEDFDWQKLTTLPNTTVRSHEEYKQHFVALRLAMLSTHVEVMKQSLIEHFAKMGDLCAEDKAHIQMLIDFLCILRNACLHADEEFITVWSDRNSNRIERIEKSLLPNGLNLNIPVIKFSNGVEFNHESKDFYLLHLDVELGKEVLINDVFFHKMRLISWHVLTITRKHKSYTLEPYLHHVLRTSNSK